ncbi:MAG: cytochrome c [Candidatus Melainabacteria bacterium]|nr:cytochrome c [Candidatus Melainabacteria bacterium]
MLKVIYARLSKAAGSFWALSLGFLLFCSFSWVAARPGTAPEIEQSASADKDDYFYLPSKTYKAAFPTLDSQAGEKVFKSRGCMNCHSLFDGGKLKGGKIGPMLSGIGAHLTCDQIIARISEKREHTLMESIQMSHVLLSSADARLIASYLLTLPEPDRELLVQSHLPAKTSGAKASGDKASGKSKNSSTDKISDKSAKDMSASDKSLVESQERSSPMQAKVTAQSIEKGAKLFFEKGCMACHSVEGRGGRFAPPLDGVSKLGRSLIERKIGAGANLTKTSKAGLVKMPAFALKTDELKSLTDYLISLPPLEYQAAPQSKRSEEGRALFAKYQCSGCHAISGGDSKLGPNLAGIGGHRGRQWLTFRLLSPEEQSKQFPEIFGSGRAAALMPHQAISKDEAEKIVDYLFTL